MHNYCSEKTPWSSKTVREAYEQLSNGAKSVTVENKSQAEELFLRMYQGEGYLLGHGKNNPDARMAHLQIHPKDGKVIRIFFGTIGGGK